MLPAVAAAAPAGMRPLGRAEDLGFEFADPDRPALVTALLAQCSTHGDADHWWAQTVGARTAALLQLAGASGGIAALPLSSRCGACAAAFDFELPLGALADAASDEPLRVPLDDARHATLRRPTGADLRAWHRAPPATRRDAVGAMLAALCIEGEVTADDEAAVAAAVSAQDPLVAFSVDCECPECAAPQEVAVDLETLALDGLAARQQALLVEVHRLASRYGWSEPEVLAVPAARRARYLALIDASTEGAR